MEGRGCGEACGAAGQDGVGHGRGWEHGAFAGGGLSDLDLLSFGFAGVFGDCQDDEGGGG